MKRARGTRKRTQADQSESHDDGDEILAEVHQLFNKVRTYVCPPGEEWTLPDPNQALCHPHVSLPPLQKLKQSLNLVKSQLSDNDLSVWHQHTCSTNRAGTVASHVRATTNAELCTQAWVKFYEILGTFHVLPDRALASGELNSVHLCEAPGAFICALNHFLKTSGVPCDWNWVANTLNPYYEANSRARTITDDRLLTRTLPWWFFGSDNTGDIMLQKHLLELPRFVANMGSVDLVTADGSFDCQGDPGEQERAVAPLQYCEAVCALLLLGRGGSLVLKMFTLLEHSSVCLLYLLACCFRSLSVFKPATSKAGNSELYVVCLDYQARESVRPLLAKLIRSYGPDITSTALFPLRCVPASFLRQHEEICGFFHGCQVHTIQENLRLFSEMSVDQQQRLERLRECAAEFYIQRFGLSYLPRKRWVCRGGVPGWVKACERKQVGSFNQRREMRLQGWKQHLLRANYGLEIERHRVGMEGCDVALSGPPAEVDLNAWFCLEGAVLPKVCTSFFCDQDLLDILNEAVEENLSGCDRATLACSSCSFLSPPEVLSKIRSLSDVTSCLVLGSPSWCDPGIGGGGLQLEVLPGPLGGEMKRSTLHDGDPDYQLLLLESLVSALQKLVRGSSLVVPLLSALTRFTAGLVFSLHSCFRNVTFHLSSACPSAALVCTGFTPSPLHPPLLELLRDVLDRMKTTQPGRQVLQFVPMEELCRGDLPHFLLCFNNAVVRQRLHVLWQVE